MRCELVDAKLILHRTKEERLPLLRRLRRIEGQVRGLIEMIEADRHCGDELQQISAARAGLREVSTLLALEHMQAVANEILASGPDETLQKDLQLVLRAALDQA